jgi:hypothetical protein
LVKGSADTLYFQGFFQPDIYGHKGRQHLKESRSGIEAPCTNISNNNTLRTASHFIQQEGQAIAKEIKKLEQHHHSIQFFQFAPLSFRHSGKKHIFLKVSSISPTRVNRKRKSS